MTLCTAVFIPAQSLQHDNDPFSVRLWCHAWHESRNGPPKLLGLQRDAREHDQCHRASPEAVAAVAVAVVGLGYVHSVQDHVLPHDIPGAA